MAESKAETVVVTGANGQVGEALLARLRSTRFRTVALTRQEGRLLADHVLVGRLDSDLALQALREADCVVHLAGALRPMGTNTYREANQRSAETVAYAVHPGDARRILYLSCVGADPDSENDYLRTKGAAERVLAKSEKELVVFRCAHIVGAPTAPGPTAVALMGPPGKTVNILGDGQQRWAPVYRGDVVDALAAALERGEPGTYDLAGPDIQSLDDWARLFNHTRGVRIRHIPPWAARFLAKFIPSLPLPMVEVLLGDCLGDSSRAVEAFGLELASLEAIWH